jgi:hypothetical protein
MFVDKSEYQLMKPKQSLGPTSEAVVILFVFFGVGWTHTKTAGGAAQGTKDDRLEGRRPKRHLLGAQIAAAAVQFIKIHLFTEFALRVRRWGTISQTESCVADEDSTRGQTLRRGS